MAAETPLFLLAEPFAALGALTRERLQEDVRQVSAVSGRGLNDDHHFPGGSTGLHDAVGRTDLVEGEHP